MIKKLLALALCAVSSCVVQTEQLEGVQGPPGTEGSPGAEGSPGVDGTDGDPGAPGTTPWSEEGADVYRSGGAVGIGTNMPQSAVHLVADAPVGVRMEDAVTGTVWEMFQGSGNALVLNLLGSGVTEVIVEEDGDVRLGCTVGASHDLMVCDGGAVSEIDAGETQFSASSSREQKDNIRPLEASDILAKIQRIGAYRYDFKGGPNDRIGLMAEDFHAIFGRGSNKKLSGHEVQMAMWLAIQALIERNAQLNKRLSAIEGIK